MEIHDEENEESKLFNFKSVKENEISSYEQCVTNGKDMRKFALYSDDEGRLYRPRVLLTKKLNFVGEIDKQVSERYIAFDVYILPVPRESFVINTVSREVKQSTKRVKREKPKREVKAEPPNEGEEITFHLRSDRGNDRVTVKKFTALVQQVNWGTLLTVNQKGVIEIKAEENFGYITVAVNEIFSRSLIIRPEYELLANLHDLPA